MQNLLLKFRQFRQFRYINFEKPDCLKTDGLQLPLSLIFFVEVLYTFPTYQCLKKGVRDFFLFCLAHELLINLVSVSVQQPGPFLFWQINSMVVGARQSCQFFGRITCFLKTKRTFTKFLYGILHYLIRINKLSKISVH